MPCSGTSIDQSIDVFILSELTPRLEEVQRRPQVIKTVNLCSLLLLKMMTFKHIQVWHSEGKTCDVLCGRLHDKMCVR